MFGGTTVCRVADIRSLRGPKVLRRKEMFNKILFPTDFSEASTEALEYIKSLKDSGTEEVVVLHVVKGRYSFLPE